MSYQSATLGVGVDGEPVPQVSLEAKTSSLRPAVRLAFYLFIFSLPFEMPQVGLPLEVTTLTGSIFLLSTLLQPRLCFRRPPLAFWCFVLYLYIYIFSMIWHSAGYRNVELQKDQAKLLFLFFQLILLCWTAYNVMREDRYAKAALLTLAASCTILAAMNLLGIARTTSEVASNVERFSTFGQNPNSLARHLAVGLIALTGLAYGRYKSAFRNGFLMWPIFMLILMAIANTGSRGSVLALGVGLSAFLLRKESASAKLKTVLIVMLAMGFGMWILHRSETMTRRFERTIDEGNLAKREDILPAAWDMFLDKPMLGWGPTINMWELGSRIGEPDHRFRDTHNLLLEVLTTTGVLGAIPFFAGVLLCLRAAWRGRGRTWGVLPLALIVTILMVNQGSNLLYAKLQWLLFAYALASDSQLFRWGSYRKVQGVIARTNFPPRQIVTT